MKTFSEHLHDVVSEVRPLHEPKTESMDMCEEAAKRYARESVVEHLERAAENVTFIEKGGSILVNKDSIRNIEIKLP